MSVRSFFIPAVAASVLAAALQVPAAHVGVVMLLFEQTRPHTPQFDVLMLVLISQPLASIASQLPNDGLHEPMAHVPVAQVSLAFAREQTVPHDPQLVREVSDASQPFASVASQFPYVGLQAEIAHEPVEHVAEAFARAQLVMHAPQCASVVSACSQPVAVLPSQSPKPGLQVVA